jgi:ssDNA thymidine ADP-ribosyltransferase, DarT
MTKAIEDFVAERGIKSLFHFTRLDNIPSILADGLLTKEACAGACIAPVINDPCRYDGTGAISATISFPNYRLFYRLRCDNPGVKWVVLELKCSLLWRTTCAFSNTNAGDSSVSNVPISERRGLSALQSMFSDYGDIKRATLGIPHHYTTNPQAEVLLLDGATMDDITGVYFEQEATLQIYKAAYPDRPLYLNGGFFVWRSDFEHWKPHGK